MSLQASPDRVQLSLEPSGGRLTIDGASVKRLGAGALLDRADCPICFLFGGLEVSERHDGSVSVECETGCAPGEIVAALGMAA